MPGCGEFGQGGIFDNFAGDVLGGEGGLVPVTGVVKYADGSPVTFETGMIVFQPTSGEKSASSGVEKDGSFTMMSRKEESVSDPVPVEVIALLTVMSPVLAKASPPVVTDTP